MSRKTVAKSILYELPLWTFMGHEKKRLITQLCTALIEDRIEIKDVPDIEHVGCDDERMGRRK